MDLTANVNEKANLIYEVVTGKKEIPASYRGKNWEHTGIRTQVVEEIREFAIKNGIQKVVLFGSRARGDSLEAMK